ncbi:ankyrin repeat domain-containing protein 10-like isoform X1 [Pomacea canaliculata]|uniref:ankyrin repeat domain-containing protein 10-like isoform X1 n=1 Tax=Pomacea canaliculata TaxID=400727 RepID=UPI000D72B709|nr:ankyrin repeat domain-containing protein 10-like isoform X1 [Pomacea canaliculata]XP_025084856.1 ankyrin repeat domain-containing protein 10-like isoform X1 [Pomacea canaliculata]
MNHTETSDDSASMFRATMPNFIDDMTEQILRNQYPLHFACRNGDEEQLKRLLESKQHFVYEEDGLRGWTPMHWAAFSGSLGCLRALGCQPMNLDTISSRSGVTSIHVAAQAGHARCLRWLLQCGISCIQQDFKGDTPLHKAAHSGSLDCVILLVAHGASLSLRNHSGHAPSEVAEMNKHQECAMYLQQALHALQTGVVAPCHSNNPLILMNGEPIYESQNKPDCSRLTLQAGEDQEMEMGEEALDNAVCQEGRICSCRKESVAPSDQGMMRTGAASKDSDALKIAQPASMELTTTTTS